MSWWMHEVSMRPLVWGSLELCSQRVAISNIPAKHTCKVSPSSFMLDTMSTHHDCHWWETYSLPEELLMRCGVVQGTHLTLNVHHRVDGHWSVLCHGSRLIRLGVHVEAEWKLSVIPIGASHIIMRWWPTVGWCMRVRHAQDTAVESELALPSFLTRGTLL